MRAGQYEKVAPGLFNTAEFDQPLVANLIDTTARDVAEVMAPLPAFNCQSASLSNASDQKRQDKRAAIANAYVQKSRLQNQMFAGTDRYNSFGFMAYMVEPTSRADAAHPVGTSPRPTTPRTTSAGSGVLRGLPLRPGAADGSTRHAESVLRRLRRHYREDQTVEVVRWHDAKRDCVIILDDEHVLYEAPNPMGKCMVVIVERPDITDGSPAASSTT
jgi:hypothetical protein